MSRRLSSILSLLFTFSCSLNAAAQATPVDAEGHQWWQHAVFYEIYPRSFADSNNDGIEAETGNSALIPPPGGVKHGFLDSGIAPIQVGLS